MLLRWHGHSCFSVICEKRVLLIDPYDEEVGYSLPKIEPDVVVESHQHHDHNAHEQFKNDYVLVRKPIQKEIYGFRLKGYATFHDEVRGESRGPNIIFHITTPDGFTVVHCGDLGHMPEEELLEKLRGVDVLLIPIGGVYTIDSSTAMAITESIAPSYVVPMHYKTKALKFDLDGVESFISGKPYKRLEELKLESKKSGKTDIVLLNYR